MTEPTISFPAYFLAHLAKLCEWAESAPRSDIASIDIDSIDVYIEGDLCGKLIYQDDQWQFAPDEDYWGFTRTGKQS